MYLKAHDIKTKLKAFALSRLASKRQSPWSPDEIKSVLVMRYDRIGDMVVTTPLLRALRKLYPEAIIDVLASQQNAAVLGSNADVSQTKVYPNSVIGKLLCLLTQRDKYDLVIDLNHSLIWQAVFELLLLRPKWVICPNKGSRYGLNPRELTLYDRMATKSLSSPIALIYLDLVNMLRKSETQIYGADYHVPVGKIAAQHALRILSDLTAPFLGLNMSGGRPAMSFERSHFQTLVRVLLDREPEGTVLVFAAPDRYHEMIELKQAAFENDRRVAVLKPTDNIMDAAAIISHLKILVTPDTSLVHFACANKVPLVAVYANEQKLFTHWQPISTAATRVCFSSENKSLRGYSIGDVVKAVGEALDESERQPAINEGNVRFKLDTAIDE